MIETHKRIFRLTRSRIALTIVLFFLSLLPFGLVTVDSDFAYGFFGVPLFLSVNFLLLPISLLNDSLNIFADPSFLGSNPWKAGREFANMSVFVTIGVVYCYLISSLMIYVFNFSFGRQSAAVTRRGKERRESSGSRWG